MKKSLDQIKDELISNFILNPRDAMFKDHGLIDGCMRHAFDFGANTVLEQAKLLAGALEFYADTKNYTKDGIIFSAQYCGYDEKEQVQDFGIEAEKALAHWHNFIKQSPRLEAERGECG